MQKRFLGLAAAGLAALCVTAKAQHIQEDSAFNRHFIGSTLFMLENLSSVSRPEFVQLNFGYRLTGQDLVMLELKTWKYEWPLGIPYGPSFRSPAEAFPGHVREYGFACAYQRFLWKGLFAGIQTKTAWQRFINLNGRQIGRGFQVLNTLRVGYHIALLNNRFFVQPSLGITHRPYHTAMPESFREMDERWSKFFFGAPGLDCGINF
jgi:hypothetical protein